MSQFKLSVMSLAMASVFASNAWAQAEENTQPNEQEPTEIETIEVRGFKQSLIKSLNLKRFSDTVSEQISADDLGSLPDVSIADALTRLPGISAVRTGGQAAEINIRGMSGGFVFSTLNGREQVSTSGSRSIEFDQYPSELITSAAVYKSPKASLIEGGVAGTVELKTASPLDSDKEHKFVANVRGMHNDRASEMFDAEEYGHRLSFSYQGKLLDETLGVSLGYARLYQPHVATQFVGLVYNDKKDVDGLVGDTDGPEDNLAAEYISEGMEFQHKGGEETRNGYVAAIEWRPVDNFTLSADAFLSRFDSEAFARGFRVKFGGPQSAVANPILDGNSMIGGTFNRTTKSYTRVEMVNDDNQDFDEVDSYGINANWEVTDKLTVTADVSLSSAKSDFRNGLLWASVAEDANAENPVYDTNVSINYQLNGLNLPDVGFNQAEYFTDINKMMVSKYGIYPYEYQDDLTAYRLDFDYELESDWFSSIEFGVRYSDREYVKERSVFEYGDETRFDTNEAPLRLTDDMVNEVDWQGAFSYLPSYLAIDLDKALAAWFPEGTPQPVTTWGNAKGVLDANGYTRNHSWSVLQSVSVYEKVLSAYVMVNINAELGDLPVTGNIGIRRVDTDQSATILENVEGDVYFGAQNIVDDLGFINNLYAPQIEGLKYTDYLPSLNLNVALTDNQQLRFAAAKVMSRPSINRLAGDRSAIVNPDGEINGSNENNPYLRPFYANQFDLSYEFYFEETDGALVVAAFYKDIDSFIDKISVDNFDFAGAGFNVPETIEDPVSKEDIAVTNGTYTTAFNNETGGTIQGVELAYTQVFSFLPEPFDGLGINASYSYTTSEIQKVTELGGASVEQALPGLSENVVNTTLFYGYQGFETRVNMRYRDEFVSEQVAIDNQEVMFDGETVFDFQAKYDFNEHFGILFQANNFTDEPTISYFGNETRSGTTQYFGRQFYLGFTYAN